MLGILAAFLTQDATIRLPISFTGALTAGSFVATTTTEPPLVVSSQVQVANLNASLLNGQPASAFVLSPAMRIRGITYIAGCEFCPVLAPSDSQPDIYINLIGPMLIRQVRCLTDGGASVTARLTITGQLPSDFSCPGNAQGLSIPMALGDIVGLTVLAGGAAHRVTFAIGAEVQ